VKRVWQYRDSLLRLVALTAAGLANMDHAEAASGVFRLSTFSADVTPPIGHALLAGACPPARRVVDPLFAHGFVLTGAGKPIVYVAIDWCEIRNDAYDRWREVLAESASTTRERVMVTALHQHDTPLADLEAQRLLDAQGLQGALCDPDYHEAMVQRVAAALRAGMKSPRTVTHFGTGQAAVEQVASNRRYVRPDGTVTFARGSATADATIRAAPVGTIDPMLKTLSFFDGDKPVVVLSCYATHPMSFYRTGCVSNDFVGIARAVRQSADASVLQIYVSGCSGDVTAGKWNAGEPTNRLKLAGRIHAAMVQAFESTERHPIEQVDYRVESLMLKPRDTGNFSVEALEKKLAADSAKVFDRCLAAMGLSWHKRCAAGQPIDVPVLDLGRAKFVVMPGEAFVGFQLAAQQLRPDAFVMVAGYGESAPGYIPTGAATRDGFIEAHTWCWVQHDAHEAMIDVLKRALHASR